MQEPEFPLGSSLSLGPPRRKRRQRTLYSAKQRQELEEFFASKLYPTYKEREALAAKLNLQEYQVQVWFKNHRAKRNRLLGLTRKKGRWARAALQGPGVCVSAPAPSPAPAGPVFPVLPRGPMFSVDPIHLAGPVFPEDLVLPRGPVNSGGPVFPEDPVLPGGPVISGGLVFSEDTVFSGDRVFQGDLVFPGAPALSEGPGVCSPPPPSAFGVVPAAEPDVSSHSQVWWDPAQGAQTMVPAAPAPAPAPVWPRGSYAPNSSPDPDVIPNFSDLLSLWEEPSSSSTSGYQGDDSVGLNDSGPKVLLNL